MLPDKINPAIRPDSVAAVPSETIQICKTRAIGVDGEYRALHQTCRLQTSSHTGCCPIKSIRHADKLRRCWLSTELRETMQVRKTCAIGVDGEHRAIARTAALRTLSHTGCCPIKPIRPSGLAPSLLVVGIGSTAVKLCRFVKPVPSVLTPNTVPLPACRHQLRRPIQGVAR